MGLRKKFFRRKVVQHWHRVSVGASSLKHSKSGQRRAVSNLIYLKMSLLVAGGLD